MAVRLDKPWIELNARQIGTLAAQLGVYQLADAGGDIVYIGVANGLSRFGLRGELEHMLANPPAGATQFRYEVNMAYHTRHLELLQVYLHDHGELPRANTDIDVARLGRLRPG